MRNLLRWTPLLRLAPPFAGVSARSGDAVRAMATLLRNTLFLYGEHGVGRRAVQKLCCECQLNHDARCPARSPWRLLVNIVTDLCMCNTGNLVDDCYVYSVRQKKYIAKILFAVFSAVSGRLALRTGHG